MSEDALKRRSGLGLRRSGSKVEALNLIEAVMADSVDGAEPNDADDAQLDMRLARTILIFPTHRFDCRP